MELRQTVDGLRLVLFAPSELGVYAKPVSGGFAPISPTTVLRDSGAQAAINGNMFDTCAGQDLPSDNAGHYRQSVCDIPEYMVRDGNLFAPGIYPTRGATISVADGVAVVRRGADAPSNARVAVQGYPALVLNGQRQDTAHSGSNIERVYRSMLARMNDGRLALIAGVGTMDSIADAAIAADAQDVVYLDGGGSAWLQTTEGGSYGAAERRPVASWVIVRPAVASLGTWLLAGAAVATGIWLFWPRPGARMNPAMRLSVPTVDTANTDRLRMYKKLAAKNDGSLVSAIESAGYYARRLGKPMFVYAGNSYGHALWRVSYKPGEYLNRINNTGATVYSVDSELTILRHDVIREG